MKKADLRTGMRVTTRDGHIYIVILNCNHGWWGIEADVLVNPYGKQSWERLNLYNEDLTCREGVFSCDIVKVERPDNISALFNINHCYTTIWERPEPKEMTLKEIEALLGYPIKIKEDRQL